MDRCAPICLNWKAGARWLLVAGDGTIFFGRFGQTAQRVAETLMNSGSVHFVASDAHDCQDRPPNLAPAYFHVVQHWGQEYADALFIDHPTAVVMDEPISWPRRSQPRKRRASASGNDSLNARSLITLVALRSLLSGRCSCARASTLRTGYQLYYS